ncbi:helix-turn-helix domain-containing protein [Streptomyces sp. NPDC057445]|uniref:helix-turn-helix domain-containing protein n=1 Tax=Streptomyces sp. NPDC057445 TaxID=3346136 RepID=UPI0036BDC3F1
MPLVCVIRRVGALNAERRAFREKVRLQAGARSAAGVKTAVIAKNLRVSVRSAERRRRAWREVGMEGLAVGRSSELPDRHRYPVQRARGGTGQGPGRARLRG